MGQREPETASTARNEGIRVDRSVRRKDGGVTVEYAVETVTGEPVEVRVREPLDPAVSLDEAGFHPQREPSSWELDEDALRFDAAVPEDDRFETVFGAVATEPFLTDDPQVERLDAEAESSGGFLAGVRSVFSRSGGTESETAESESEPTDGVTVRPETDDGAETVLAGAEAEIADAEELSDEPAGDGSEEPTGGEAAESGNTGGTSGDDAGDGVGTDTGAVDLPETEDRDETGSEDETEGESAVESESEPSGVSEEDTVEGSTAEDGPNEAGAADGADDEAPSDSESRSDGSEDEPPEVDTETDPDAGENADGEPDGPAAAEPDPEETAEAVVSLVAEDEAVRTALRDALGVEEEASGSVDTRLRHVQSRVDDLAAYSAALEESIDEHGEPAAAFSELQEETAAIRDDVSDVESEVATVRAEQAELAERVDDLAGATESLRAELEELQAMRESLSAAFGGARDDGERLAAANRDTDANGVTGDGDAASVKEAASEERRE